MLSLPLMFESIGFDGPGVLMEDAHMATVWTYKANFQFKHGARPGPNEGCDHLLAKNFGPSTYARLALRAILPTYFRHRYICRNGLLSSSCPQTGPALLVAQPSFRRVAF